MTLAVAAVCPWGPFIDRYQRFGLPIVEHVILASDSRWSVHRRSGYHPLHDVGKKVYELEPGAAAVFSGDVTAGNRAIGRLRRLRRRSQSRDFSTLATLAEEAFASAYEDERRMRPCEPLYCLVAAGSPRDGVTLMYCSYERSFRPEIRSGVQIIGDDEAKWMFVQDLGTGMTPWWDEGELLTEVTTWAIAISASLDRVVERRGGTLGGKVQLAIVSPQGYHPLKIVSLDKVAIPPERDVWRTITNEERLIERPPGPTSR